VLVGQEVQQRAEHYLLLLDHVLGGNVVGNEGTQIAQGDLNDLVNSLVGNLLHYEIEVLQGGHFPVHDQKPELPPDLSTGHGVLDSLEVVDEAI
jgi:hypothetical protein